MIMKFSRYNLVLYCDKGVNLGSYATETGRNQEKTCRTAKEK